MQDIRRSVLYGKIKQGKGGEYWGDIGDGHSYFKQDG